MAEQGIQETSRDKLRLMLKNHRAECRDEDCDLCAAGQSGSSLDDSVPEKPIHNKGTRTAKARGSLSSQKAIGLIFKARRK
jgi:hypothetical protein